MTNGGDGQNGDFGDEEEVRIKVDWTDNLDFKSMCVFLFVYVSAMFTEELHHTVPHKKLHEDPKAGGIET